VEKKVLLTFVMQHTHLQPLELITQTWKAAEDEDVSYQCLQQVVAVLTNHYDQSLNQTKTDFRDPSNKVLEELDQIMNWVVNAVERGARAKQNLKDYLALEICKHQNTVFRTGKKSLALPKISAEDALVNCMDDATLQDPIDVTMDQKLPEDEEEEEEEEDEGDDDEGDSSDSDEL
jgi:hypothetical protein